MEPLEPPVDRDDAEDGDAYATVTAAVAVDPARPDEAAVGRAADVLRRGGLVAFPTETVYGLGADATSAAAVARVFAVKGRPATDPLIVHVPTPAAAAAVAAGWDDRAERLAARFWPGPLTLVVPRSAAVVDEVGGGRPTVGLRVPAHPVALALLDSAGVPVAAPSANRFGRVSPTAAAHVLDELAGHLDAARDLVLDGGPSSLGVESTVVDLTGPRAVVLRPGGVGVEELREVLDDLEVPDRLVAGPEAPAPAPGTFLRHYSPRTPVVLVEGGPSLAEALAEALTAAGTGAAVLGLPEGPADAAARLYAALRGADGTAEVLVAATVPPEGIGRAVNDRLFRAAVGRVATDAGAGTVERLRRTLRP